MAFDKVRIRFSKTGDLRLVSHLDLMRSFERLLRRSQLPFRSTEGFHPAPRLIVAHSLPLGLVGLNEVVELELLEPTEPEEVLQRFRSQTIPGLQFLSAQRLPIKASARPRRGTYRFVVNAETHELATLAARCETLLAQAEVWCPREKPQPREVNIRPYIETLKVTETGLHASVWITQNGTLRPEEIAREMGLGELALTGLLVERTFLELHDEISPEESTRTPVLEQQTRPWNFVARFNATPVVPSETWGATENGPIVE